jgi:hypothetical protein
MIILFAMINSLAASENALQEAIAPLDRAAWGVYVGDGKIGDWGGERRRSELFSRITAKRPRRLSGGRRGVDLPSGHRQPEQSVLRAPPFKERQAAPLSRLRSEQGAGPNLAGSCLPFARDFRADASPRMESGKPLGGSTTRPGLSVQPAGHRLMVPAKRLTQLLSEPVARTRSEFVTRHK